MSELNEFKVQQIVDNGRVVQISLVENVHTEPISQRQVVMEKVSKRLDGEARSQIMPLLDIILQAQPQLKLRTYQQTTITVSMPRNRYDRMGRPQVGHIVEIDMSVKPAAAAGSDGGAGGVPRGPGAVGAGGVPRGPGPGGVPRGPGPGASDRGYEGGAAEAAYDGGGRHHADR